MSDTQIRDARRQIRREVDYFQHWYTRHSDMPRMGSS